MENVCPICICIVIVLTGCSAPADRLEENPQQVYYVYTRKPRPQQAPPQAKTQNIELMTLEELLLTQQQLKEAIDKSLAADKQPDVALGVRLLQVQRRLAEIADEEYWRDFLE